MAIILDVIQQSSKSFQLRGNEASLCCPFCVERGETEDTRFRLGINVSTAVGHCFNCHWKGSGAINIARQLCKMFGLKMDLHLAARKEAPIPEVPKAHRVAPMAWNEVSWSAVIDP